VSFFGPWPAALTLRYFSLPFDKGYRYLYPPFFVRLAHLLQRENFGEEIWMLHNHCRPLQSWSRMLNASATKTASCSSEVASPGDFICPYPININHLIFFKYRTAHWIPFRFALSSVVNVTTMFPILLVPAAFCCCQVQFWETRLDCHDQSVSIGLHCYAQCVPVLLLPRSLRIPCFLAKLSLFVY
jgi:hypothetical protein